MSDTRREQEIEEREEPSLVYARRNHMKAPVELVIVEHGKSTIWPISPERQLQLANQLLNFYATGPKG